MMPTRKDAGGLIDINCDCVLIQLPGTRTTKTKKWDEKDASSDNVKDACCRKLTINNGDPVFIS